MLHELLIGMEYMMVTGIITLGITLILTIIVMGIVCYIEGKGKEDE